MSLILAAEGDPAVLIGPAREAVLAVDPQQPVSEIQTMGKILATQLSGRVVEVQDNQVAISTGPYAIVRHPMYLAVSVIFILSPLALGSYWALIPALLLPVVLAVRIDNEEQLLRSRLAGYEEYCQQVKYRLLPFIW